MLLPTDVKATSEQKQTAQLEMLPHNMQQKKKKKKTAFGSHTSDIAAEQQKRQCLVAPSSSQYSQQLLICINSRVSRTDSVRESSIAECWPAQHFNYSFGTGRLATFFNMRALSSCAGRGTLLLLLFPGPRAAGGARSVKDSSHFHPIGTDSSC